MVMHFHRRGRLNGSTLNVVGTTRSTDDKAEDDEKRAARAAKKREKYANLTPEERREVARQANAARNKRMGWGR
jgi:acyl-CoA reductase-like NAD-dependent aldehyde dehydrogenase